MPGRPRSLFVAVVLAVLPVGAGTAAAETTGFDFGDPGAANAESTVHSPVFADVPDDHRFASEIRALFVSRVSRGCNSEATAFCPEDAVTRGEMAAFLTRTLDLGEGEPVEFTDDDGNMFEPAIEQLAANGITRGCNPPTNDRYCPDDPITRGQMAAFLSRALPLEPPPAVPAGVQLGREAVDGTGIGTRLEVCRDHEVSLMVRSITGGTAGLGHVVGWEPSASQVSSGEVDIPTDRWYLPADTGCEILDLSWNPRDNMLSAPLSSLEITSPFGYRIHPVYGGRLMHTGTDFDADAGDPVFAAAPGVVVSAATRGGYGRVVDVKHAGGLITRYAHLSSIRVSTGTPVDRGDVLGGAGCTGTCTGSHLHFETIEWGTPVDPMRYLGN